MTLASLAAWLRCPHCFEPLEPHEPLGLRCARGHAYDVNKRGFVNLVPSADRMVGDNPRMLAARDAFLAAGHFAPVAAALSDAVPATASSIIDAGCGTGYYLAQVRERHPSIGHALAFDLSPDAVRLAVRSSAADGLATDTWRPLPIRDGVSDVVVDVFAPRNLPEFHRILAPGGSLIVVVPTPTHLGELRDAGRVLDIPGDKAKRLVEEAGELFSVADVRRVEYVMHLSPSDALAIVDMGPSAHHHSPDADADDSPVEIISVTASVDVVALIRR